MTSAGQLPSLDADQALRSVFKDPDWMFKTGIGGTLNAGFLVILIVAPILLPLGFGLIAIVCGYLLRLIRTKAQDASAALPGWADWLELAISGLTWMSIQAGLLILVLACLAAALFAGAGSAALSPTSPFFFTWAATSAALVLALWLVLEFLRPYLMANLACQERLSAGFAVAAVLKAAARRPMDFILVVLLASGIQWLSILLPLFTVVGIFLLPSTVFLGHLICASLIAQVWGASKDS